MHAFCFKFLTAALRVSKKRVPAVNDDIALLQEWSQLADHGIHGRSRFDHDHGNPRAL
jgi:hypothetical protein